MSPAPGTVVKPVFVYDDEQREKMRALREVRRRQPRSPRRRSHL
jgi:hypothetical protein